MTLALFSEQKIVNSSIILVSRNFETIKENQKIFYLFVVIKKMRFGQP